MKPVLARLKGLAPTLSVGLMAADMMRLGEDLASLAGSGVEVIHFDVMDGCFCPSMTAGPPMIKGIRTDCLKDVHLMIADPLPKLMDYVAAGADILTVHYESEPTHIHRVFQSLQAMKNANDPDRGIVCGVALNPGTPVEVIRPLLDLIDMVTLLAINPGWGGQRFDGATEERVAAVRQIVAGRPILVCVDGGITRETIGQVACMQPDLVVTGSAVFDGKTPAENARTFISTLRSV